MLNCPNCGGRSIGRVGTEQYYCWDCCVEFNRARGSLRVYHLDVDGELIAAAGPGSEPPPRVLSGRQS